MKKFKVVFAIDYEVEAEDENDARDIAEKQLVEEFDSLHIGLTEIFGCNVEEVN